MPDHWKEIAANVPQLAMVGMVANTVDGFIEGLPYTVKVVALAIALMSVYGDLKTDLAVINAQNAHAAIERGIFQEFMSAGDRCTLANCEEIKRRVTNLEGFHFK